MTIVITTPTGHIGKRITERLIDAGAEFTVIARDPAKLSDAVRQHATVKQGDLQDTAFVTEATAGAAALFWLTPPPSFLTLTDPNAYYKINAEAAAAAVQTNRIPYVVNLSSAGAQHATGLGPVSLLQLVEDALNKAGENVIHLRPGYFMENYLTFLDSIRDTGNIYLPVPGTIQYPMIATQDIGDYAAKRLLDRSWTGKSYQGLHGPADFTFDEAAAILTEALRRPIQHVQITPEQMRDAVLSRGATPQIADTYTELYVGMAEAIKNGTGIAEPRTPESTTPTTLAEFAIQTIKPLL